jgi:hypothetical protein
MKKNKFKVKLNQKGSSSPEIAFFTFFHVLCKKAKNVIVKNLFSFLSIIFSLFMTHARNQMYVYLSVHFFLLQKGGEHHH